LSSDALRASTRPRPILTWSTVSRLIGLALVIGLPLSQVAAYAADFAPRDLASYLWAGEAWRTTGSPYTEAAVVVDGNPIYRYAPWFALPWIWLSHLPRPVIEVGWAAATSACAGLAVVPVLRAWGRRALPLAIFFFGWLMAIGLNGNVQPAVIALLAWGVDRRWGPVAIAVAASLKAVPILYVVVYAGRGEWSKVALTLGITAVLVGPMLLFDIPASSTDPGASYSLYATSPIAWAVVACACVVAAFLLARTAYAWLAAGLVTLMALPRAFVYDITFLLPGLSERGWAARHAPHPGPAPSKSGA
jgi:hypothetical protein